MKMLYIYRPGRETPLITMGYSRRAYLLYKKNHPNYTLVKLDLKRSRKEVKHVQ